jgi:hypothetical protein
MHRAEAHAKGITPKHGSQGAAAGTREGLKQGSFDQRGTELGQQRRVPRFGTPSRLARLQLKPEVERIRRSNLAGRPRSVRHHREQILNLALDGPRRILRKPLRRQMIGRHAAESTRRSLHLQSEEHVRHGHHRDDAVTKGQTGTEVVPEEFSGEDAE